MTTQPQMTFEFPQPRSTLLRMPAPARSNEAAELFTAALESEQSGDRQSAILRYEEVLRCDPEYIAAHINLGTLHFQSRLYGLAEECYRRATPGD